MFFFTPSFRCFCCGRKFDKWRLGKQVNRTGNLPMDKAFSEILQRLHLHLMRSAKMSLLQSWRFSTIKTTPFSHGDIEDIWRLMYNGGLKFHEDKISLNPKREMFFWRDYLRLSDWLFPRRFPCENCTTKQYLIIRRQTTWCIPTSSMYGMFKYTWLIFMVNVGKYAIHDMDCLGYVGGCYLKTTYKNKRLTHWLTRFLLMEHFKVRTSCPTQNKV